MIKYIDIHSHLGFADFGKDMEEVIKRMNDAGVATITVGTDLKSSIEAVKIAEAHENIWASIGAHPEDDPTFVFTEKDFAELVKSPKVVAIGECGLDYYRIADYPKNKDKDKVKSIDNSSIFQHSQEYQNVVEAEKERQKKEFIKQIEFSIKYDKPLMLHIRDAHDDAYELLKKYPKARGNLHFFTGSSEVAKKFIELGYTISFPGVITFAKETEGTVKNIPLDKIHAETDSPFAAPIPYRGKRNEPSYVIEVVKKIAELRGEDIEKVRIQLLENAKSIFSLNYSE